MSGSEPLSPAAARAARHAEDDPRAVLARPLAATSLLRALDDLARDVDDTSFPLAIDGVEAARASRDRLVDQLYEHLVPRLTQLAAPAVVVVSGSTGAGKSSLVNALVGREVTAAGVLRPTTRQPVLVHHPDDTALLSHHPVLAEVRAVADTTVPRGIALLDAPDLDSVLTSNREAAHRLLEAADLWLFVTTAARYGDALPWQVLAAAVERRTTVAMVLNRVPPESLPTVRGDLLVRLRERGLGGSPLFVVPDIGPHEGMLPEQVVAPIRRWLTMLAGPDRARTVVGRTLRGSLDALRPWVDELAEAVQDQADAAAAIAARLDDACEAPREQTRRSATEGSAADGLVRARWAELTADGGPLAGLAAGRPSGSARAARGLAAADEPLLGGLTTAVGAMLVVAGEHASRALRAALVADDAPAGSASLLAAVPETGLEEPRASSAHAAARAWVAQGPRAVQAALLAHPPVGARAERARRRLTEGVPERVLGAVALAAAAGVADAERVAAEILDEAGPEAVAALRDELAERAAWQVERERAALALPLATTDLAADASSRLRLRLAVLKGLT